MKNLINIVIYIKASPPAEAVSKVFFNRGGAKAQRKLVLIMKYFRILCDSATLRFL
jgi:hypothetical protein